MVQLKDYRQFEGIGWSTGYVRNALDYQGVIAPHTGQPFTEALVMGINGGICAGYFSFEYEGHDPHLHFLTRFPFNEEPGPIFERLATPMETQQTTNTQKALANVINALAAGKPAIVWVDVITLLHGAPQDDMWMMNPVVVYGCDVEQGTVSISDRARVPIQVSLAVFEAARGRIAKTKNRMMTLGAPDMNKLPAAVEGGIRATIAIMHGDSPFGGKAAQSSWGLNALQKWARLLDDKKDKTSWLHRFAPGSRLYSGLTSSYKYLEVYYTGGQGARPLFADFLDEAALILNRPALGESAALYRECARHWKNLTEALLPDEVAPLRETRELLQREYQLYLDYGNAKPEGAYAAVQQRLTELRAAMETGFPLSDQQAAALRAELKAKVLALHDAEKVAVESLAGVMG